VRLRRLRSSAQTTPVPVTADNFRRAEADWYFGMFAQRGAFGKFFPYRELPSIDLPSVRPNRDTLYTEAVWDLDTGPVTITVPGAGKRFISLQVIDQDPTRRITTPPGVYYGAGTHTLTRQKIGTRYVFTMVRILVDPADREDVKKVHALQDAIKVKQPGGPGRFEVPNWDLASQKKVQELLLALGETLPDWERAAGRQNEVDPVRHLIVTASGWGLNPERDAMHLNVRPSGTTARPLQAPRQERRAGRRLLVDQPLRRARPVREESVQRLCAE
jgi:hypothetical protein